MTDSDIYRIGQELALIRLKPRNAFKFEFATFDKARIGKTVNPGEWEITTAVKIIAPNGWFKYVSIYIKIEFRAHLNSWMENDYFARDDGKIFKPKKNIKQ